MNNTIKFKSNNISSIIKFKHNYILKYVENISKNNCKVFCIVDNKIKYVFKNLKKNKNIIIIYSKSGEEQKNINNFNKLCNKLLSKNIKRDSILIAIGGGTLGDTCGFIASTLLRGVKFILIPTTLLSQVDSSIGGKNGINTEFGKNLIGTFYQPEEVLIDTSVLKSLPKNELSSGYAEIIKHALISDVKFFNWLENNYTKIFNLDKNALQKAIFKSITIKLKFVKRDPKENLINSHSRAMLNFGHTFGHSLETFYKYKNINHGEAISIGMIAEAKISNILGYLNDIEFQKIISHFRNAGLKLKDKNISNNKIFKIMLQDKKNTGNQINIILLKNIGSSFFKRNINIDILKRIIKKY
tara:strand:- start:465 stop:1535 length:1071 start_codon:yes stop_codon:yes gene_type:complete